MYAIARTRHSSRARRRGADGNAPRSAGVYARPTSGGRGSYLAFGHSLQLGPCRGQVSVSPEQAAHVASPSLRTGTRSDHGRLDIHKDSIAAAVAWPGRTEPEYRGAIRNTRPSVHKLIHGLQGRNGEALSFAYEAGPCGYGVYREITGTGHDCQVVAPGLIPRKPADRVKTDRRDALTLARLHRAGELTPVWCRDRTRRRYAI